MLKWRIGEVTVTQLIEGEPIRGLRQLLTDATPEAVQTIGWLHPHFADAEGRLKGIVQSLVVEAPGRRIVVDTCVGNDKERINSPRWSRLRTAFLEEFEAAGFARDSIDTVLCTHLHVDHVGWNTMLVDGEWIPTFPKARYLMGREEFEYWRARHDHPADAAVFADSVRPVWDAGLVDLVETDHRLCGEVSLRPTPGHTKGHVSVRISSKGEEALITGDFVHHPCQMARPGWTSSYDYDPQDAVRTRERMFAELAGSPVLVIGTHFAQPTAGHIVRDGDAYRLAV